MRRALLLASAALLAAPAAADAGSYDVVSCNAPGAGGVNRAWVATYSAINQPPRPEMYDVYDDCSGAQGQGGLVANSHNGNAEYGNAPFLTGGVWQFNAPAGTVISHVTVWRHAIKYRTHEDDPPGGADEGDTWLTGAQQENGNIIGGSTGETCHPPAGTGAYCEYGADGINAASQKSYDLSATAIFWGSVCAALESCPRFYGVSTSNMKLSGARVTLTDTSAPSLTVGPTDGWLRPGTTIGYDASDNVGIRSARVEVGKAVTRDDRSCDYRLTVPCANVKSAALAIPAGAPDGRRSIRFIAEDTAGNPTTVTRTASIDGTAPLARLERPHGRVLRVRVQDGASGVATGTISVRNSSLENYRDLPTTLKKGILSARLDKGRIRRTDVRVRVSDNAGNEVAGTPARIRVIRARVHGHRRMLHSGRLRVPFGRSATITGQLTLSAGQPIHDVSVVAVSRVRRKGAPLRGIATVGTDRHGRFTVHVPKGPSRTVGLRFAGIDQALHAALGVPIRVAARSTIHASRRSLGGAARVSFSGRMKTMHQKIPDKGLVIVLQGRDHGRWLTFADTRTNRKGRWHASYFFRGNPGSYPVRVKIRRQAGYPFELGYSKRVTIHVR
jgi:hypothetical protein